MKTAFQTFTDDEDDSYWFELGSNFLTCYKNSDREEMFTLKLNGFQLCDNEEAANNSVIVLFNPIRQNLKRLLLSCEDIDELNAWKKCFAKVLDNDEKVNLQIPFEAALRFRSPLPTTYFLI